MSGNQNTASLQKHLSKNGCKTYKIWSFRISEFIIAAHTLKIQNPGWN